MTGILFRTRDGLEWIFSTLKFKPLLYFTLSNQYLLSHSTCDKNYIFFKLMSKGFRSQLERVEISTCLHPWSQAIHGKTAASQS